MAVLPLAISSFPPGVERILDSGQLSIILMLSYRLDANTGM